MLRPWRDEPSCSWKGFPMTGSKQCRSRRWRVLKSPTNGFVANTPCIIRARSIVVLVLRRSANEYFAGAEQRTRAVARAGRTGGARGVSPGRAGRSAALARVVGRAVVGGGGVGHSSVGCAERTGA